LQSWFGAYLAVAVVNVSCWFLEAAGLEKRGSQLLCCWDAGGQSKF